MKFYSNSTNIKFKWDQVSNAVFKRYPNPWSKHVLSEDVVSREVEGPILRTVRILTKTNKAPKFAARFIPTNPGVVVEESHINAKDRTIITYTRNLCYKNIMEVDERCEYKVSPDSKNWTLLKRQAWVSSPLYGFSRALESLGVERYKKNIKKSIKGLDYVLGKMYIPEKIPCSINTTVPIPRTM